MKSVYLCYNVRVKKARQRLINPDQNQFTERSERQVAEQQSITKELKNESKEVAVNLCECGCGGIAPIAKRTNGNIKKGSYRRFILGHFSRTQKHKDVMAKVNASLVRREGTANPNWKGGRSIHGSYITVRINGKSIYEHRYLMEQKLGRSLLRTEIVHHKNGNTTDNSIDNLELLPSQSAHLKEHLRDPERRKRWHQAGLKGIETQRRQGFPNFGKRN